MFVTFVMLYHVTSCFVMLCHVCLSACYVMSACHVYYVMPCSHVYMSCSSHYAAVVVLKEEWIRAGGVTLGAFPPHPLGGVFHLIGGGY